VLVKHNIWNYVFFFVYLKQKPAIDYTGTESYVSGRIRDQDNSWFPENDE